MEILHPPGWPRASGFSHGVSAAGRIICVAGQVGWDENQQFQSHEFADQVFYALRNTVTVLAEGGARPEHIVRMTWYVTDKQEYLAQLKEVGQTYREVLGRVYPAMALFEVSGLVEDAAKVEIETTAVVPDGK